MPEENPLVVDKASQTFQTIDILSIWSGITICLPAFMLGGILIPSLSFSNAVLVTIAGNLIIAILVFLMALPGIKQGYSSAYLNHYYFGYPFGHVIPSAIVMVSMTGWAAILLDLAGRAAYEVILPYIPGIPIAIIFIILGILISISSFAGPDRIRQISKLNLPALAVIITWLLVIMLKRFSMSQLLSYTPTNEFSIYQGLDIVIGGTIAGAFVSSDLCRYACSKRTLGQGVFWGIMPAAVLLAIVGIFSQLMTGTWNPVYVIKDLGMGIPALLLIIVSTWTTIQASIYSGSLALCNILPGWTRKKATIILCILLISLTILNITSYFEQWLLLLDNLFAPMIAITLTRYFIGRASPTIKNIQWATFVSILISIALTKLIPLPLPETFTAMGWAALSYIIIYHFKPDQVLKQKKEIN
ncbi:MAG: cytosine permease [Halanaerobium sp.]|nr:cytosine permease [Halanaerobium sp.]